VNFIEDRNKICQVEARSRKEMNYYKEHKMNYVKERLVVATFSIYLLEAYIVTYELWWVISPSVSK
jgi:hypothetical protein